jgi:hypothetical protein
MPLAVAGAQILEGLSLIQVVVILSCYILLPATSGWVVAHILKSISGNAMDEPSREVRDTGYVIGKCENLLLLTFMLLDAFTAMALIFTAKAIVRAEDMKKKPLYFLAGTMVNVTLFHNGRICPENSFGLGFQNFYLLFASRNINLRKPRQKGSDHLQERAGNPGT